MSTSSPQRTKRPSGDKVHPESGTSQLGKFVSRRPNRVSESAVGKESRVANMISAFNSRTESVGDYLGSSGAGDFCKRSSIKIMRTSSTGSIISPPLSASSVGSLCGRRSTTPPTHQTGAESRSLQREEIKGTLSPDFLSDVDEQDSGSSGCELELHRPRLTQSLGRNEVRRVAPRGNAQHNGLQLAGKIISLAIDSDDVIPVDTRVQKTLQHFKSGKKFQSTGSATTARDKDPVIKPLGVTTSPSRGPSWKRTTSPRSSEQSPKRQGSAKTKLQATNSNDLIERGPSPTPGGISRIDSNPFLQKDRMNSQEQTPPAFKNRVSTLKGSGRERISSTPILLDGKTGKDSSISPTRGSSKSPHHSRVEQSLRTWSVSKESVSIQDRIKLWAEIEKTRAQERDSLVSPRVSPKVSPLSSPNHVLKRLSRSSPKRSPRSSPKHSPKSSRKDSPKSSPGSKRRPLSSAVAGEDDDVYEDVVVTASQKIKAATTSAQLPNGVASAGLENGDAFYDDVEVTAKGKSKSTRQSAVAIERAEAECIITEDLYATIPGENYGITALSDTPPALPPRPADLQHSLSNQDETLQGEQLYDEVEISSTESPKVGRKNQERGSPAKGSPSPKRKTKGSKSELSGVKQNKSRWKFSPRLGRRKEKSETATDEKPSDAEVGKGRVLAEQHSKIAGRRSKKRTAMKKRNSSTRSSGEMVDFRVDVTIEPTFENGTEEEHEEHILETSIHSSDDDAKPRSGSSGSEVSRPRATTDPTSYLQVTAKRLDPRTGRVVSVSPESDVTQEEEEDDDDVGSIPRHAALKRKKNIDKTLSREIYDMISTMGDSEDGISSSTGQLSKGSSHDLLMSENLSAPADMRPSLSESNLLDQLQRTAKPRLHCPLLRVTNATVKGPAPSHPVNGVMEDLSGDDSSSDADPDECPEGAYPIETSLDIRRGSRASLKRQRNASSETYDPSKTLISSSQRDKLLLSPVGDRRASQSPSEEGSESVIATPLMHADAVWDRVALETDELSFRVGDVIEILDMTDDVWWHGSVGTTSGWFPASFVRLRVGQDSENEDGDDVSQGKPASEAAEEEEEREDIAEMPSRDADVRLRAPTVKRRVTIRRRDSTPAMPKKLSPQEVRAKVVEEILNTERDYVHHLEDIIEGFLKRCREYNKLFDGEKVENIFSNVEQIYHFQRDFLRELETRVSYDQLDKSQIGEVFVSNRHQFAVYSEYCNNHPHAVNEMNVLQQNDQYALFFESCRLLRNLQDISLEGYLLTPVQKICKYPLQLCELLKYTDESHPDYTHVLAAQKAMRDVAMLINEQKRRMENIGKIGRWQETIENWKGDNLLELSTELIHSGELHKISKGHSQERHFFLFDHQIVYCKKDAIGGKLSYKGRLDTDKCRFADMPDGAAVHGGNPVKNAWRMNNEAKDKWYVIYAKSLEEKLEWMEAFKRERERVKEDEERGFKVSLRMKRAAVIVASAGAEGRRRRRSFSKKHGMLSESVDTGVRHRLESSGNITVKKLGVTVSVGGQSSPKKAKSQKKAKLQTGSPMLPRRIIS